MAEGLGKFFNENHAWISALTLVGVILLLFNVSFNSGAKKLVRIGGKLVEVTGDALSDGFTPGSSLGHQGSLSGLGQVGANAFEPGSVRTEVQSNRLGGGEMMGNLETPVFWNPGLFADIDSHHQAAAAAGQLAYDEWANQGNSGVSVNNDGGFNADGTPKSGGYMASDKTSAGGMKGGWAESMTRGYVERMGAPVPSMGGQSLNPY